MSATIYTNFTLYKWLWDIEGWYRETYYPKGYTGHTFVLDEHLKVVRRYYNYDQIEGNDVREKRINFFNFCQTQTEQNLARPA